jgi:hypothetical protein
MADIEKSMDNLQVQDDVSKTLMDINFWSSINVFLDFLFLPWYHPVSKTYAHNSKSSQ